MRVDLGAGQLSGRMLAAPDPRRDAFGIPAENPTYVFWGEGTGRDMGVDLSPEVSTWIRRFTQWRDTFEQEIGPNARRYWALYRNFDDAALPGPNQAWRDRTVLPIPFKIVETRLPRLVMAQFGYRDYFSVEGRDARDEKYEETVRVLMSEAIDEIGRDTPQSNFLVRVIDGFRYGQIMGHVWFKVWWRTASRWIKTQVPASVDENGKVKWKPIEMMEPTYNNVDVTWLGLGDLAIDTSRVDAGPGRRWAIERVQTSLEALRAEDERWQTEHGGERLYTNLDILQSGPGLGGAQRESFEEPRDTEGWPLNETSITGDPGETAIELWLCWDNVRRTLTKIANRRVVLDHGLAPTPDGLDPFIGVPAVPIPGRSYGDSILNWVGPLAVYATRLIRARADEVLLNIWQQFVVREGALRSSQFLHRPGGIMTVEQVNPDRPLTDVFARMDRKPVFQEAFAEPAMRQQEAEQTAAADATVQGIEATSKSRDVSATEIKHRITQGASRYQLENLYLEVAFKGPLMRKIFDNLRANLTQPKTIRVIGEQVEVDLRNLENPVDIIVGGGLREISKAERREEVEQAIQLAQYPVFQRRMREETILKEAFKTMGRKDPSYFVKTDEEVEDELQREIARQAQLAAATAPGAAGGGGAPGAAAGRGGSPARPAGAAGDSGGTGASGAGAGLPNAGGQSPSPAPSASSTLLAEI